MSCKFHAVVLIRAQCQVNVGCAFSLPVGVGPHQTHTHTHTHTHCRCTSQADSHHLPVPRVLEGLLSQRHASARSAFLSSPTVRCHVPARFSSSVPAARQPTLVKPRVAVLRASVGMSSSYSASHALSAEELAAGPPTIDISPLLEPGASVSKDEVVKKISKAAAKWYIHTCQQKFRICTNIYRCMHIYVLRT